MAKDKITYELVSLPPHEEKCHNRLSRTKYSNISNMLCRQKNITAMMPTVGYTAWL